MAYTTKQPKLTRAEKKIINSKRQQEVQATELAVLKKRAMTGELVNATGRPSVYTPELDDEICAQVAMGRSIRSICGYRLDADGHEVIKEGFERMPSPATIFNWFRTNKPFLEHYERAKEQAAEAMADEILDIADNGSNDWMDRWYGKQQEWVTNGESIQRSKLRVDTRVLLMTKLKPKKYGQKLDLTSGGKDLPTPILGVLQANQTTNIDQPEPPKYIDAGSEK
ncbi:MAG: hypothetical protein NVS1B10_06180 [Candidatus Saccharimonadales bacterium]